MVASRSCHAPVRFYRLKTTGFLDGGSPDLALVRSCARIRGWLHASLARGAKYVIWNKHAFVKRSGLRMHYVEQAMRTFRKTTTEFDITQIRLGRSPRLKITYRGAPGLGSIAEVRARLLGYIRTAARANKGGVAKVDARFLEYFCKTSKLPREVVGQVWLRLSFVKGCRCHWRGVGANLRFVVQTAARPAQPGGEKAAPGGSLQESSLPHGSPSGRRYEKKTMAPAAPGGEHGGASPPRFGQAASERSLPTGEQRPPARSTRQRSRWPQRTPADPNPRSTTKGRPAPAGHSPSLPENRNPLAQSFQVGDRWISGEKIMGLAKWLAVEPMQAMHHRGVKVIWRFAHARNFAARALRFGHRVDAILAAYQAGVRRSHDDASMAGETVRDHAPREPSAAVNYAWRELLQDTRSRAERWAGIFAGERAPRMARVLCRKLATDDAPDLRTNTGPAEVGNGVIDLDLKTIEQDLLAHLATKKLTLAEYNQLPWEAKKRLLQGAIAQRLQRRENNK